MKGERGDPSALVEELEPESQVDPQLLAAVRSVVDSLLIALKTYILFPPYNVNVKRTLDSFDKVLQDFFADHLDALVLDTGNKELQFEGESIFPDPGKTKGLSYRMNKDGVLRLIFHEGVERQELVHLLEVHQQAAVVDEDEDDFVTLLWEKDCTHIQLVTHDTLLDPSLLPELASIEDLEGKVFSHPGVGSREEEKKAGHVQPRSPVNKQLLEEDPSAILTLAETEREELTDQVQREDDILPLEELIEILTMVCQADREWSTFDDGARMVRSTIDGLIVQGNFDVARTIAEKFEGLKARAEIVTARHVSRIDQVFEALGEGDTIEWLTDYLRDPKKDLGDDLRALLMHLRGNAVKPLMSVFLAGCHLEALAEILVRIGHNTSIAVFVRGLESESPEVVQQTLDMLFQVGGDDIARHLLPLLSHPDGSLRQQGLAVIAEHGGTAARVHLVSALGDRDRRVRRTAVAALLENPFADAFDRLWDTWEARAKLGMDSQEEETVLAAAMQCNAEAAVRMLTPLLNKRVLRARKRKELEEQQRVVIFALARADHPVADEALRRFATGTSTRVRQLCQWALQKHRSRADD